jgi:hypothetical protein
LLRQRLSKYSGLEIRLLGERKMACICPSSEKVRQMAA